MPGYARTPFLSAMTVFKEQPPIAAFISTDTVQNIPSGIYTKIAFTTPINDDPLQGQAWQSLWNAAQPDTFVITVRGWYHVGACVEMAGATAHESLRLTHNVVTVAEQATNYAGQVGRLSVSAIRPALAGDTFTVELYQDSGAGVNTFISGHAPQFWIVRIG